MTHTEKVFLFVGLKGHPCRPQSAAFVFVVADSVAKGQFGLFGKDLFAVRIKHNPSACTDHAFQFAADNGSPCAVVLKDGFRILRYEAVVFVNHPAIGKVLKANGIFTAGGNAYQFPFSGKQELVFCYRNLFHNFTRRFMIETIVTENGIECKMH